jgi:hypothetical protein
MTTSNEHNNAPVPQDSDPTSKEQYRRMLVAACEALGAISDVLGCDPEDGGAEPILGAVEELHIGLGLSNGILGCLSAAPAVPVAWWIPRSEQFCLAKPSGKRPFAKAWEPLYAATPAPAPAVLQNTDHFEDDLHMVAPFGYFRPEPFGWTDCAKDDEGAVALYERPQEWELRKELDSANDFIKSLADLIQKYETMLGYRTTNAPEGAYALAEAKGESSVNAELDLAFADSTCQHDFALDPKSSIRICLKCGTPERLAKKAPAPAQEVGLTDEEIDAGIREAERTDGDCDPIDFERGARFAERALRAKGQRDA